MWSVKNGLLNGWGIGVFLILVLIVRIFIFFSQIAPYKDGDKVRISSKVVSEPVSYERLQYLKLQGFKMYLPLYPEITYGNRVVVEGVVEDKGEDSSLFGMRSFKLNDLSLKNAKLIEIKESKNFIYNLRLRLLSVYRENLPQPHSALVSGIAIGSKSDIPSSFWEKLKVSGTAHVVVASGMNVTLVAAFLMSAFTSIISRRKAVIAALAGIWIYAVIAGFDAPIIRAAIMGSLAFSALAIGRLNFAWRALFLSAYFMLIFRPDWITDLGFILSFTATASLMFFQKYVKKIISKLKVLNRGGVFKDDLVTTLSAQIGVAPILFFSFGQFNILSPVINAAVLWTIPFITILGLIGGFMGLLYVPLGQAVLFLTYPLTLWFVTIVSSFG